MLSNKEIRKNANEIAFKSGKTGLIIGTTLLYFLITCVISGVQQMSILLGIILNIFVGISLVMGYYRFTLNLAGKKEAKVSDIFSGFTKNYWKKLGTYVMYGFAIFLHVLVALIPAVILGGIAFVMAFNSGNGILAPIAAVVIYILVLVVGIYASYKYILSVYMAALDSELSASELLKKSKELMNGNKMKCFTLSLWYILQFFLLGFVGVLVSVLVAFAYQTVPMTGIIWIIVVICAIVIYVRILISVSIAMAIFALDIIGTKENNEDQKTLETAKVEEVKEEVKEEIKEEIKEVENLDEINEVKETLPEEDNNL